MRRIVETLLVVGGLALGLAAAHGGDYPSRRITLIAPWPPAGAIDTTCRELAPGVGDLLGKPVVVENRPGAGSICRKLLMFSIRTLGRQPSWQR